jgi:hypothetical protein
MLSAGAAQRRDGPDQPGDGDEGHDGEDQNQRIVHDPFDTPDRGARQVGRASHKITASG